MNSHQQSALQSIAKELCALASMGEDIKSRDTANACISSAASKNESEVEREINAAFRAADSLASAVELLWSRARPVTHVSPASASSLEPAAPGCGSEVGQRVQVLSSQIVAATISLRSLSDLLAV